MCRATDHSVDQLWLADWSMTNFWSCMCPSVLCCVAFNFTDLRSSSPFNACNYKWKVIGCLYVCAVRFVLKNLRTIRFTYRPTWSNQFRQSFEINPSRAHFIGFNTFVYQFMLVIFLERKQRINKQKMDFSKKSKERRRKKRCKKFRPKRFIEII